MREQDYALKTGMQADQLEVSRVLRNTYGLLALTLAFSGVMAFVAQQMRVGYPNIFVVLTLTRLHFLPVKMLFKNCVGQYT